MSNLAEVKAGDTVVVVANHPFAYDRRYAFLVVERTTAKQIVAGEARFWRENGREVGGNAHIHLPSEMEHKQTYGERAEHDTAVTDVMDIGRQAERAIDRLRSRRDLQRKGVAELRQMEEALRQVLEILAK